MVLIERSQEYLEHHGILKQKWGVRHGPPYPLNYDDHSPAQKKANPKSQLNNYENNNSKDGSSSKKDSKKPQVHNISEAKLAKKLQAHRRKEIEKTVLKVAAIVGVGAAAYLAYKYATTDTIKAALDEASEKGIDIDTDKLVKEAAKQSLDDLDYVFNEGDTLHRMHAWEDFDLDRTVGKGTYVTFTEEDRAAYMRYLKDWHGTGERYDISLKVKEGFTAPSEAKARQLFAEFYKNNPEYQKELYKTLTNAYSKLGAGAMSKAMAKADIVKDPFKAGVYSIVKSQKDSQMLFDMYRKAGYGAIIDYFDKGTLGKEPLIVFDAKKDLIVEGSTKVNEMMKEAARRTLVKDPSHPMYGYAIMGY